jgi:hypothetical protein
VDALAVHRPALFVAREQRVQRYRQGGGEGLALTGLHLGDRAVVQHHPADQLHVEVALAQGALGRLAGESEGLEQQLLERLAVQGPLAQGLVALPQLVVALELELGLERVDPFDVLLELPELLLLADPQCTVQDGHRSRVAEA